jgi:F-type H+-transporting ATPase subunit O
VLNGAFCFPISQLEFLRGKGKPTDDQQYTAAVKSSSLESVAKAVSALNEVYHKDPKLATILEAPTLSAEDKSQIIAELQKHTGGVDKEGTVKNFLSTLADYNRLGLLKGVCEKFGDLMSAARGEVELTITSAVVSILL